MATLILVSLICFVVGLLFIGLITRNTATKEVKVKAGYEGGSYRGYSKNHGQYTKR